MSLHAGENTICEITYIDMEGLEVQICEVAIGSKNVFGCPEPPVVESNEADYSGGIYTFKVEDFTKGFVDPNGDGYLNLKLVSLPEVGTIKHSGVVVPAGYLTTVSESPNLTYEFPEGYSVTQYGYINGVGETVYKEKVCLKFRVSDDSPEELYSEEREMCLRLISATPQEEDNLPPTIGDVNLTVDMGITTIITMDTIKLMSDPRYSDPENDPIVYVRINSVKSTNIGTYYVNNIPIFAGQMIPVSTVESNLFKYVGHNSLAETPDSFDFSVQDTKGNWSD